LKTATNIILYLPSGQQNPAFSFLLKKFEAIRTVADSTKKDLAKAKSFS